MTRIFNSPGSRVSRRSILLGAARLFVLALVPMAVMAVPVTLILGQLSLWYQQRPLQVGEEAVVTLTLNGDVEAPFPEVRFQPTDAVEMTVASNASFRLVNRASLRSEMPKTFRQWSRVNPTQVWLYLPAGLLNEKKMITAIGISRYAIARPA